MLAWAVAGLVLTVVGVVAFVTADRSASAWVAVTAARGHADEDGAALLATALRLVSGIFAVGGAVLVLVAAGL